MKYLIKPISFFVKTGDYLSTKSCSYCVGDLIAAAGGLNAKGLAYGVIIDILQRDYIVYSLIYADGSLNLFRGEVRASTSDFAFKVIS